MDFPIDRFGGLKPVEATPAVRGNGGWGDAREWFPKAIGNIYSCCWVWFGSHLGERFHLQTPMRYDTAGPDAVSTVHGGASCCRERCSWTELEVRKIQFLLPSRSRYQRREPDSIRAMLKRQRFRLGLTVCYRLFNFPISSHQSTDCLHYRVKGTHGDEEMGEKKNGNNSCTSCLGTNIARAAKT